MLEVTFNGKNIDDILTMTIDDAVSFFTEHNEAKITRKLKPLQDVGLGYVTLGQSSSTLSGGEAQRIKLAAHLSTQKEKRHTLFIFDEQILDTLAKDDARLCFIYDSLEKINTKLKVFKSSLVSKTGSSCFEIFSA